MTGATPPSPWMRSSAGGAPASAESPAGVQLPGETESRPPAAPEPPAVPGPSSLPGEPGFERAAAHHPPHERHPADPDEIPSSKAWAVLALGVVGVALMFCGGGLVPGLAGLLLARPAKAEMAASAGFLTGRRSLRTGEVLSWIAVAVSTIVIVAIVIGLLIGSVGNGPHYDQNVN